MRKLILLTIIIVPVAHADWNYGTEMKRYQLVKLGMPSPVATSLITHCKETARDPEHCIKIGASIMGAESSIGNKCINNNVFGVSGKKYASKKEAVYDWVRRYNKYWFRQQNPDGFYSNNPRVIPKTQYCMSEHSSGSKGFCPNGHRNAWKVFNSLTW